MMPDRIGQFEVRQVLGSGSFGHVYAAIDTELGRQVAIKALRAEVGSNPASLERFRAEGVSLARLSHPNITTLYALQRIGQDVFLVMELVEGRTLDRLLAERGRLALNEVRPIITQVADGLGYAHRNGIIHRDIKPANLMLTPSGMVKIMDFGIARIQGTRRMTREGVLGTCAYMAPEQFRGGDGDERSDLYGVACLVYEMLSGSIPFDAATEAEMMHGHLEGVPASLLERVPDLDPVVDAAVLRALAKRPDDRFDSVQAFAAAIGCEPPAAGYSSAGLPPTFLAQTRLSTDLAPSPARSGPKVAAIATAAAVVLAALGGGAYFLFGPDTATDSAPAMPPPPPPAANAEGDVVSRANALFAQHRSGEAEELLVTAAHRNDVPAMVALARLYNPLQSGRPAGIEPNPSRAARYYRDAVQASGGAPDQSIGSERSKLRGWLEAQSRNGDSDARIALERYDP